ncbi:Putative uncharacterized protein Yba2 [Buchnera aphidicola (Phyllaphis fagi)]|uniref:DUF2076 domain-containing protein n=1 Tax=Buchnera aphidicola TaxID=9 RepID=UPI003464318C
MKDTEKTMIENLFSRLKHTENKTPNRDQEAERIIHNLSSKQVNSIYYMVQTILVQESIIHKLNNQVKLLQNAQNDRNNKNTEFLSSKLGNNIFNTKKDDINSNYRNDNKGKYYSSDNKDYSTTKNSMLGGVSSFLGNAVQTAVGVAGGMVAGNMLTNLFNHDQSEKNIENNLLNTSYLDSNMVSSETDRDHLIDSELSNHINPDDSNLEYVEYQDSDMDDMIDDESFI